MTLVRFQTAAVIIAFTASVAAAAECPPAIAALEPSSLKKVAADDRAAGLPGAQRCASAQIQAGINVVAYTAADIGAVRVVKNGTPPSVLYEVPNKIIGGYFPSVTALDVDGDHTNEAVVSFTDSRGTAAVSIYRWDGTKLVLISPSEPDPDGNPESTLTNVSFIDVNGDGKLAFIDEKATPLVKDPDGSSTYTRLDTLYSLQNGSYQQGKPLLFFAKFIRATGAPKAQPATISGGAGCATSFLAVNGNANKSARVSSAEITLNAAMVVRPDQFNQNVPSITTPIAVKPGANTLTVKLAGAPGGEISVVIPACQ